MWFCKKCNGNIIVSQSIVKNIKSGNDFHENRDFGKVKMHVQVCWCADCGTPHSSAILDVSKIKIKL